MGGEEKQNDWEEETPESEEEGEKEVLHGRALIAACQSRWIYSEGAAAHWDTLLEPEKRMRRKERQKKHCHVLTRTPQFQPSCVLEKDWRREEESGVKKGSLVWERGEARFCFNIFVLGSILSSVTSRLREVPLYSSLVKFHLECCIQLQSSQYKKDMDLLQKLQRKALKMIRGLEPLH